jgi:hypothetical protein
LYALWRRVKTGQAYQGEFLIGGERLDVGETGPNGKVDRGVAASRLSLPTVGLRAGSVILGALICLVLVGYGQIDLAQPATLSGDHLYYLTFAKSYIAGHGFRFNESLGYPGVQDGMYFPAFDMGHKYILWLGSRFISSPISLMHVFYLVAIPLIYVFCYWALRRLAISHWTAALAGIAFVVSPYLAVRAGGHDFLAMYYSVPLGAALALQLGSPQRDETWRQFFTRPFTLVALAGVGTAGVYYTFFSLMFVSFLAVGAAIAQRAWRPLALAAGATVLIAAVFVLSSLGLGLVDFAAIRPPVRLASEQVTYGLVIADAIRSLANVPIFKEGADVYGRMGLRTGENFGEWPGFLLSGVILASPLLLLAAGPMRRLTGGQRRTDLIFLCAACLVFGLLFAVRAGMGLLFNIYLTPLIRAQERILPFLSFFALVIICVLIDSSRASRARWVQTTIPTVLLVGLLASAAPSVGALFKKQKIYLHNEADQSYRRSMAQLLQQKEAAQIDRVLQLPILPWPEVPRQRMFDPYSHALGFVMDRPNSRTRWSYGSHILQPAYRYLSWLTQAYGPDDLVPAARAAGFDAILIEKLAYDEADLQALERAIEAKLAPACKLFDDRFRTLYALGANNEPSPCIASPDTKDLPAVVAVSFGAADPGEQLLLEGWGQPEEAWTSTVWSRARMVLPIPAQAQQAGNLNVTLHFEIVRPNPDRGKRISITVATTAPHVVEISPGAPTPSEASVDIRAGAIGPEPYLLVAFRITDSERYPGSRDRDLGLMQIRLKSAEVRAVAQSGSTKTGL